MELSNLLPKTQEDTDQCGYSPQKCVMIIKRGLGNLVLRWLAEGSPQLHTLL